MEVGDYSHREKVISIFADFSLIPQGVECIHTHNTEGQSHERSINR